MKKVIAKIRDARERHAERSRPTGLGFALADSIRYLDAGRWDAVTQGGSVFLSRGYFEALEAAGPTNLQMRYALLFRGARPVAAVAMQLVQVSAQQVGQGASAPSASPMKKLLREAFPTAEKLKTQVRQRVMVCGNLLSWGFHAAAFAAGEDPATLWPGIAEAIYRVRRAERLSGQTNLVMVKDISEREAGGAAALERFSYRALETEPNMVLEIRPEWRSYDDYLASLDGSYRKSARKIFKELEAAGCTVAAVQGIERHAEALHRLYLQVHENASLRLVTLPATYLPALERVAGESLRTTLVRRAGETLGFVTTIKDGETAIAYYIGFDRAAAAGGVPLYLRLMHTTVADAIAFGCKRLSLGRTALEPKSRLGARPEKTQVYVRHRLPALNWLVRGLLQVIPHDEPPERHPFKKQ